MPLHCASFCFRNSEKFVDLVGAQFRRHGAEVFSTRLSPQDQPVFEGFGGFESWDETYIHHRHNERDRIVLEYRDQGPQARGSTSEPWTWIRQQGKGRVFYTAWGHDLRTWNNPGFQNLVERGIRWACGGDPGLVPAFERPPARFATGRGAGIAANFAALRAAAHGERQRQARRFGVRRRWTQDSSLRTERSRQPSTRRGPGAPCDAAPALARSIANVLFNARRLFARVVRRRARYCRQADCDELGMPAAGSGFANRSIIRTTSMRMVAATIGFASAKTPTATARPTSSRSSPRS